MTEIICLRCSEIQPTSLIETTSVYLFVVRHWRRDDPTIYYIGLAEIMYIYIISDYSFWSFPKTINILGGFLLCIRYQR